MIAYIDDHRQRFGVEPICSALQFAPRSYYAAKARRPSTRAVRDAQLKPLVARVHRDNYGVYGVDKVWAQLNREGTRVARCTVARLMREVHHPHPKARTRLLVATRHRGLLTTRPGTVAIR